MATIHETSAARPDDYVLTRKDARNLAAFQRMKEYVRQVVADAPPMSPETWERVEAVFSAPTPPTSLMRWKVKLSCGHINEAIRHISFSQPTMAGSSSGQCTTCNEEGLIVAYEPIGPVAEFSKQPVPVPDAQKLDRRIAKLQAELESLQQERTKLT